MLDETTPYGQTIASYYVQRWHNRWARPIEEKTTAQEMGESEWEFLERNPNMKGTTSDDEWEAAWMAFREDTFDPDNPYSDHGQE